MIEDNHIKIKNIFIESTVSSPLMEQVCQKQYPTTFKYWLGRLLDKIKIRFRDFNLVRQDLLECFGERDENGKIKVDGADKVKLTNPLEFQRQIRELHELEVSLEMAPIDFDIDEIESFHKDIGEKPLTSEQIAILIPFVNLIEPSARGKNKDGK